MPRIIHQLKVFVASPGDVQAERTRVERVVREINLNLSSSNYPIQFELVRWETHSYPSFGSDPQTIINKQIGNDYDIFIGILWARVGTPTPRFPSGTLEEFEMAYQRWKDAPDSIGLMIYFKEEPLTPWQLDPNHLAQIQKFKAELPNRGGLYWTFKTVDDFETDVRLHLTRSAQDWRIRLDAISDQEQWGTPDVSALTLHSQEANEAALSVVDDYGTELGFIEYMELVADVSQQHSAVLARMTSALKTIGEQMEQRTEEAVALQDRPSLSGTRAVFEQSARDLNDFSASLLDDIPQLSRLQSDLLKYIVGGATVALDFGSVGEAQINGALTAIDTWLDSLTTSRTHARNFRAVISSLPRMVIIFNKAKRSALDALDALDSALSDMLTRIAQVRGEIHALVNRNSERQ